MAKFYFRVGCVGSAKSLNLLAVAHNYQQQNKSVLLLKPQIDSRFSERGIVSRAGLSKDADHLLFADTQIVSPRRPRKSGHGENEIVITADNLPSCILVDEIQFVAPQVIDQFLEIAIFDEIPVIGYGLKTDFKGRLFPGSQRCLEVSDSIEEVKTTCFQCNKKATFNLKFVDGRPTFAGPTIELGAEEKYVPVCKLCRAEAMRAQGL